jgi:hypothetical protein
MESLVNDFHSCAWEHAASVDIPSPGRRHLSIGRETLRMMVEDFGLTVQGSTI